MMPSRIRSAAAILELAIERGVPRFNTGDQASCAALYELAIMSVVLLGNDAIGERASSSLSAALKDGATHEDAAAGASVPNTHATTTDLLRAPPFVGRQVRQIGPVPFAGVHDRVPQCGVSSFSVQ